MVESPVFYMSYKASLEGLQTKDEFSLPFIDELVYMKPSGPPSCIQFFFLYHYKSLIL